MADKISFDKLRSHEALVCNREINSEKGCSVVFLVLLSDGFLVDCGSGRSAKKRAEILAAIINEAGPERLGHGALK